MAARLRCCASTLTVWDSFDLFSAPRTKPFLNMSTTTLANWDQQDYVAAIEAAEQDILNLETAIKAKGGTPSKRPATGEDLIANFETLTAHKARLRAESTMTPERLAAAKERVLNGLPGGGAGLRSTTTSKPAVATTEPPTVKPQNPAPKIPMNETERCLAARAAKKRSTNQQKN